MQAAGFDTVDVPGGAQALELARDGVAAVVLDVHLPDLHGFEVCRLLRRDTATAGLPVIHVSAVYLSNQDLVEGLEAGADAYLMSPVEPPVLVAHLNALIRARQVEQGIQQSDQRFRGIFEKADCAIALVDAGGRIAEANAELLRLLGLSRGGLVGRQVAGLVPKEWKARVEQFAASWGSQAWRGQFPLIDKGGQRIDLSWSLTPHLEPGFSVAVIVPAAAGTMTR
nr:response regulator [Ramlibacter sp.]